MQLDYERGQEALANLFKILFAKPLTCIVEGCLIRTRVLFRG